ncbi:MAG TPA: protein meaA [Myxococcales bacterium]|nr:protein meaA [Myxococcales bacterium]
MRLDQRPPWIIRTYAGFGDATATNARYKSNLAKGQRGLSVAFDLPTQNGYDSDHPMSRGEVGGTGVAVNHLGDMKQLFDGIDLSAINTSMTINATAPWLFALYLATAEAQGADISALRGTTQNDLMKEYAGRGTYIFNPDCSLRLTTDLITYAAQNVPKWNPINVCGYHYMESGATATQEVGYAMGNAVLVLDNIRGRVSKDEFENVVRCFSFFINSGIELVAEIVKVRAYSKLWKSICKNEYGVDDVRFRAGCQVRSLTLTASQPEVNIMRIAYQALPAVISASARVGALQLPGFREALSLPDEKEQTLSLRTQQVLMYETDIAEHGDIFEGSIIIEELTQKTLAEAEKIVSQMRLQGYAGSVPWLTEQLTESLVQWQAALVKGDRVQVGINAFLDPIDLVPPPENNSTHTKNDFLVDHLDALSTWRRTRNNVEVEGCLTRFGDALKSGTNIIEASIALAKAGGTTGEWTQAVESFAGGRFSAPLGTDNAPLLPLDLPQCSKKIRIVLGKCGLDGHVNAVKLLSVACAQAGLEVIYTGIKQSPAALVAAAIQEDADILGISSLSGAHLTLASDVCALLREQGAQKLAVIIGGVIPESDREELRALGVKAVFTAADNDMVSLVQQIIELADPTI